MKGTITVRATKEGEVTIEVQGVKGEECIKLTESLEKALGKVTKREMTNEYHERPLHGSIHVKR